MIELSVNAAYIKRTDNNIISTGQDGAVTLDCAFDEPEWSQMDKTATFMIPGIRTVFNVPLVDNKCVVPAEALAQEGPLLIGVYGEPTTAMRLIKRFSPAMITVPVRRGSYAEGQAPSAVTINEWFVRQASLASEAAQTAVKAAKIANDILLEIKAREAKSDE